MFLTIYTDYTVNRDIFCVDIYGYIMDHLLYVAEQTHRNTHEFRLYAYEDMTPIKI